MKRFVRAAIGGSTVVAVGVACRGTPNVGLSLTVPKSIVSKASWYEVGAYRGASCAPILPMLGNGVPDGATARLAFQPNDPAPPAFGAIPNDTYAFAAVARDSQCGVIATGCQVLDVGDTSQVIVPLDATDSATGQCAAGSTCQAGRCIPASDNRDPSVGAACSLELLGAGPLMTPLDDIGTLVSAPAIAPTSTGFLIAYREVSAGGSSARITLLPIDASGGALTPFRPGLPTPCSNSNETDGLGLVLGSSTGMLALAQAPCSDQPALQLLNFSLSPLKDTSFLVTKNPSASVTLGAAKAATATPNGNVVVYAANGVGNIALMDPTNGISGTGGTFGGQGVTQAWVASSSDVLALLTVGPNPAATGADAGIDDDAGVVNDPTAGSSTTLRLLMVPANTTPDSFNATTPLPRAPVSIAGIWGSVAVTAKRAIVLSDGTGTRSATYRAFDLENDRPTDTGGFSVTGDADLTTGDVAVLNDRAYFATLKQGGVALNVYSNATTSLLPLRNVLFANQTRISAINQVRDGSVALAVTDARVAVVWTTAKQLQRNDVTGGYAVFACTK